jgi:transcriptional antiterminator RfaH
MGETPTERASASVGAGLESREVKPMSPGAPSEDLILELWGGTTSAVQGGRWFVLHTQPRQEKALAESLDALEVRHYLPLVRRVKYYAHRRRQSEVPLFSGYLFAWGDRATEYRAVETKRVANVIQVADQERLSHELLQVRRATGSGVALEPYRYLTVGRRCRVSAGPLFGVEGLIESLPKPDKVVLQIHALGQAVSASVDPSLVELLD